MAMRYAPDLPLIVSLESTTVAVEIEQWTVDFDYRCQ